MKRMLFLCLLAIGFCSCSPRVHKHIYKEMPKVDKHTPVTVYYVGEEIPDCAEVIGVLTVVDKNSSPDCSWDVVIGKAEAETRAAGGNGLEILQHNFPGPKGGNCHEIAAYILNIREDGEPVGLSQQAQELFHDYVVSKEGDTIRCMITENYRDRMVYVYEYHGLMSICKTPKNKISAYYIENPDNLSKPQQIKAEAEKRDYHVQIAVNGGYAFRTAPFASDISGDYKDYLRKLSRGPDLGASLRINLVQGITLGLHYDQFFKAQQIAGYVIDNEGNIYEGTISNAHKITFIGGSLGMLTSVSRNKRHYLCMDLLLGYLGYEDKAEEFGQSYTLSGKTLGYGLGIGYDFKITRHIAVGAEVLYIKGALSEMLYENGAQRRTIDLSNSKEGLQRIIFKAGLRFYL